MDIGLVDAGGFECMQYFPDYEGENVDESLRLENADMRITAQYIKTTNADSPKKLDPVQRALSQGRIVVAYSKTVEVPNARSRGPALKELHVSKIMQQVFTPGVTVATPVLVQSNEGYSLYVLASKGGVHQIFPGDMVGVNGCTKPMDQVAKEQQTKLLDVEYTAGVEIITTSDAIPLGPKEQNRFTPDAVNRLRVCIFKLPVSHQNVELSNRLAKKGFVAINLNASLFSYLGLREDIDDRVDAFMEANKDSLEDTHTNRAIIRNMIEGMLVKAPYSPRALMQYLPTAKSVKIVAVSVLATLVFAWAAGWLRPRAAATVTAAVGGAVKACEKCAKDTTDALADAANNAPGLGAGKAIGPPPPIDGAAEIWPNSTIGKLVFDNTGVFED